MVRYYCEHCNGSSLMRLLWALEQLDRMESQPSDTREARPPACRAAVLLLWRVFKTMGCFMASVVLQMVCQRERELTSDGSNEETFMEGLMAEV